MHENDTERFLTWNRHWLLVSASERPIHRVIDGQGYPNGYNYRCVADCTTLEAARAALRLMLVEVP